MWRIPVGSFFEALIDWLKDNLSFVFGAIDSVLDFTIRALEQIVLLRHSAIYPSVVAVLIVGLLIFFIARTQGRGVRVITALAGMVLFGGVEVWRYHSLERELTPAEAEVIAHDLARYGSSLAAVVPAHYDGVRGVIAEAAALAPEDATFQRHLGRIERRLERLRPDRFDEALRLVTEVGELVEDDRMEVVMTDALRSSIEDGQRNYLALTGIEGSARLARRFEQQAEPINRYTVFNRRTYDQTMDYLDASLVRAEEWGVSAETASSWHALRDEVRSLNPDKLTYYPSVVVIVLLTGVAFLSGGVGLAAFTLMGFVLVLSMGYWVPTMETLALVMAATFFALLIGVPAGIWSARSVVAHQVIRPVLDFMQTMPAFVYLIPAVLFFGLGRVPGAIATLIFAMPPAVRLTALGIRQVPEEVVEAAQAFGATSSQLLMKAQLPIAMPTILAGLNQTIMLALSMVVIGGMIGAGGLGAEVLSGITQMKIDVGFESGIAVVVLAIFLDRITQRLGGRPSA